jgi:hypothetical protein
MYELRDTPPQPVALLTGIYFPLLADMANRAARGGDDVCYCAFDATGSDIDNVNANAGMWLHDWHQASQAVVGGMHDLDERTSTTAPLK